MATNVPPMPGPAGAPPPVRKKTSPLVWILIGLAGFVVLICIAIAGLGFFVYHKAKQAGFDTELIQKHPELAVLKMAVASNPDVEITAIDEDRGIVTLRDKKKGKTITLNFADIKSGKFTLEGDGEKVTFQGQGQGDGSLAITTADGTAKLSGSVQLPSWLPAYSGAKPEGFSAESNSGAGGGFSFKISDSADKVIAFYEEEMKKGGFQVETTRHAAGAMVKAESGERKAVISVTADGSGASVSGTFEGK